MRYSRRVTPRSQSHPVLRQLHVQFAPVVISVVLVFKGEIFSPRHTVAAREAPFLRARADFHMQLR